jgi:hypothetical protein
MSRQEGRRRDRGVRFALLGGRFATLPPMRFALLLLLAGCGGAGDPDAGSLIDGPLATDGAVGDAGPDSGCDVLDRDGDGHDSVDCGGDDCADDDSNRFPGNPEICDDDAHDEDCDYNTVGDRDDDDDTYLDADCCNATELVYSCGLDCDDDNTNIHPGVLEMCDLIDEDCDEEIDEDSTRTYWGDPDGDGHGDPTWPIEACTRPEGAVDAPDDCDESCVYCWTDAPELCDGYDNDCDPFTGDICPDP